MKKLIPSFFLKDKKAYVTRKCKVSIDASKSPVEISQCFDNNGADAIIIVDMSTDDLGKKDSLEIIKEISEAVDIPIYVSCEVDNEALLDEYSNSYLNAGASKFLFQCDDDMNENDMEFIKKSKFFDRLGILYSGHALWMLSVKVPVVVELGADKGGDDILNELSKEQVMAITGPVISSVEFPFMDAKNAISDAGIEMNVFKPTVTFDKFKLNEQGLVPVIVQDYKTKDVLMLAYMNEVAFLMTLTTGKMTYYSRSRDEIWIKGETSGHYQYVHSMEIDCDNDTLLATVRQVGAACHTGNRSCFYRNLCKREF